MSTPNRALLISVALVLALWGTAPAHEGKGGLDALPVTSTRGLALGETGLTEIGEGETFMSNPSCLPSMTGHQVRATYGTWFGGLSTSRTLLIYATALGRTVDYPGDPSVGRRFGVGIALDRTGIELSGGSGWAANILYLGLAWAPVPYVSVAMAPKFIFSSSDLPSGEVSGYAVDWGLRLDLTEKTSLGFVTRNMPGSADWKDAASEDLPTVYSFGAHYVLPYDLRAEFMFAASGDVDNRFGLGIEAPFLDYMLCLRFGGIWISGDESRSALTAGFGVDLAVLDFDYALKVDKDWATGTTHRVSIRFDF